MQRIAPVIITVGVEGRNTIWLVAYGRLYGPFFDIDDVGLFEALEEATRSK